MIKAGDYFFTFFSYGVHGLFSKIKYFRLGSVYMASGFIIFFLYDVYGCISMGPELTKVRSWSVV